MKQLIILTFLMCSLFADTVKLKSGEEYSGKVVGVYLTEGKATLRMYLKSGKKDIVLSDIETVADDNQDYVYISDDRKDFGEEYYLDKDDLENFDERFLLGGLNALKKVKPITHTQKLEERNAVALEERNAVALESMAKDLSSIKNLHSFSFWLSVLAWITAFVR